MGGGLAADEAVVSIVRLGRREDREEAEEADEQGVVAAVNAGDGGCCSAADELFTADGGGMCVGSTRTVGVPCTAK